MDLLHALLRQARADLLSRRAQSLQIILIVGVTTAVLTVGVAMIRSADVLWEQIFALSNGPHAIFVASGPEADLSAIGSWGEVAATAPPIPVVRNVHLVLDPRKRDVWLEGVGSELPEVGRPILVGGRWVGERDDEIVLDPSFARDTQLGLGRVAEILTEQGRVPFTVVGFAVNPVRPYPSTGPMAYVARAALARVVPEPRRQEMLWAVRLVDPDRSPIFVERVAAQVPPGALSLTHDWHYLGTIVEFNINNNVLLTKVGGLLALIAVGLIVANATSALVLTRVREIGLLKAIGFTPRGVTLLFVIEHLALGMVACFLGIAAGLAVLPALFTSEFLRRAADALSVGLARSVEPWVLVVIVLCVELVVGVFTLLPAWRGGRVATLQAILVGGGEIRARPSRLGRAATAFRLPTPIVLGVKDAFAGPWRAWLTIVSLALTIVLGTMVLAGEGTLRAYTVDPTLLGRLPNDIMVRRGPVSHAETNAILQRQPEIVAIIGSVPMEAQPDQLAGVPIAAQAVDQTADLSRVSLIEGRLFNAPGEVIVPQGVLDLLGRKLGDELPLRVNGRALLLRIVGRSHAGDNLGLNAMFSLETARQQLDAEVEPTEYALTLAPGADRRALQESLLAASERRFSVVPWTLDEDLTRLLSTLRAMGAGLLLISLINLLNTALLGVQERTRDTGILKAVGMTPAQVVISVVVSVAVQALLALVSGAPLGVLLSSGLYAWIISQGGGGTNVPVPVNWGIVLSLVLMGVLVVALVSSVLPSRHAAGLQVAEVLRHE